MTAHAPRAPITASMGAGLWVAVGVGARFAETVDVAPGFTEATSDQVVYPESSRVTV